jgi:hypothetical protein
MRLGVKAAKKTKLAGDAGEVNREEFGKVRQVKNSLSRFFKETLNNLGLTKFVAEHSIAELFSSMDRDLRSKGNQLRSEMVEYLKTLPADQVAVFKENYGSNVTDWIKNKVVASVERQIKREAKLKKKASLENEATMTLPSGDILTLNYQITLSGDSSEDDITPEVKKRLLDLFSHALDQI